MFENVEGESIARLRPEQILEPVPGVDYESLMFAPGDGSVTLSSLLSLQDLSGEVPRHEQQGLEPSRVRIVCAKHDALTSDDELLDALVSYLLEPDPAAESQAP